MCMGNYNNNYDAIMNEASACQVILYGCWYTQGVRFNSCPEVSIIIYSLVAGGCYCL